VQLQPAPSVAGSPEAPSSGRSLYRPFQGDEERKDKCNDSREGDGKVNVMHGDHRSIASVTRTRAVNPSAARSVRM
jgi:hypothetical protein